MTTDQKIERLLLLAEREAKEKREKPRETWVSAKFIQDLTGWDGRRLSDARLQGIVTFKENDNGGIMYLVESLPWQFIKHQPAEVVGEAPVIQINKAI